MYLLLEHVALYWALGLLLHWVYDGPSTPADGSSTRAAARAVLFNQVVVTQLWAALWLQACRDATGWPPAWQVLMAYLVTDTLFYWTHRAAHAVPALWALHRHHHAWRPTTAWAALDGHPLEHLVCNLGPLVAGPMAMGWSVQALRVWLAAGTVSTLWVHTPRPSFHQDHHTYVHCNYGLDAGLWDALLDTRRRGREEAPQARARKGAPGEFARATRPH